MKIFKLEPVTEHMDSINWRASRYKGTVIVVAENEKNARRMAWSNIGTLSASGPNESGGDIAVNPWKNKVFISCREITDEAISTDKERIIEPEGFNDDE